MGEEGSISADTSSTRKEVAKEGVAAVVLPLWLLLQQQPTKR